MGIGDYGHTEAFSALVLERSSLGPAGAGCKAAPGRAMGKNLEQRCPGVPGESLQLSENFHGSLPQRMWLHFSRPLSSNSRFILHKTPEHTTCTWPSPHTVCTLEIQLPHLSGTSLLPSAIPVRCPILALKVLHPGVPINPRHTGRLVAQYIRH